MMPRSLWNKFWLETRWRFVAGVVVLTLLAGGKVFEWVAAERLLPQLDSSVISSNASGMVAAVIRDALEAQKTFHGFIWYRGFRDNLTGIGIIFVILLGCGGLVSETSKGSALFTLALPVTRRQLFTARAGVGLAQCLAIAMVPPLVFPILAPAIGQQFTLVDALAHGLCLFVGGTLFFGLATYLSTIFADTWRPLVIALVIACGVAVVSFAVPQIDVFSVMNGEQYFRTGAMPWTGLLASAVVATALLYSAAETLERRDF
jgi:ABC-type transport system involved in multi-copper enzyme maturation permease subunit